MNQTTGSNADTTVDASALRLWVWEDVLSDNTSGMVCVLARTEDEAWDALKAADSTAWWVLRGRPGNRNATGAPNDTELADRPREVTQTAAFVCWGGG